MSAELSYSIVGSTDPLSARWSHFPEGFRRFERTVVIGEGDEVWAFAAGELMRWGVKRRSGFRIASSADVIEGADYVIDAGWGPFVAHEPVRVVAIVDESDRRGFAYGTLTGHPVSGEEAFIVHRSADDTVHFTLRSLTRPAPNGPWRLLFPVLLLAQRFIRRRYLRALTPRSR